jgi:hypothetical protein
MPVPDVKSYVDLTLYDKDAKKIADQALADAAVKFPGWVARAGNTEVLLIEAMALEVAELAFAINRLPGAVTEVLLGLYGIVRSQGAAPTATATFALSDTLGHTVPSGTVVRLSLGADVAPLDFTTDVALVVPGGQSSGTVAITAKRNTAAANGTISGTALSLVDSIAFVNSVSLGSAVANGQEAETGTAFLDRGIQALRKLVTTLVLPEHFTAEALLDVNVKRATSVDNYNSDHNRLTANQSSAEVDATGWSAVLNGTLARDAALGLDGGASWRLTATAGGDMAAETDAPGIAVVVGEQYTARLDPRAAATSRSVQVALRWHDAANAFLSESLGTAVADPVGSWPTSPTFVTAAAPANAAFCRVRVYFRAAAAAEIHNFDRIAFRRGPSTNWRVGGLDTSSTVGDHLGHVTTVVGGVAGAPLTQAQKNALELVLESKALANLDTHVVDPTITVVPVTVTVRRLAGYTDAQVVANVQAKVDAYLDPATWPWGTVVRRNELIALVDQAAGVDYVDVLTAPAADVALAGVGPLADAGTITVTVTAP